MRAYLPSLCNLCCKLCVLFYNFLAVVCSASSANSVGKIVFAAFGAFCHAGKVKLPNVGTSFVASCLRYFFLRYCHVTLPPLDLSVKATESFFLKILFRYFNNVFRIASLGSTSCFSHEHSPSFRFLPHL